METKYILSLLFVVLSVGCTAYNNISRGHISGKSEWHLEHGAGQNFSRQATQLRREGLIIRVTPCNYGDKDVYMALPVPLPLGSIEGVRNKEKFIIGVQLFTDAGEVGLDLKNLNVTLKNGKSYTPVMYKKEFSSCVKNPHAHSKNAPMQWVKVSDNPINSSKWVHLSLLFDVKAPDVDDEFALSLQSIRSEGRDIKVPILSFRKGESWGGW